MKRVPVLLAAIAAASLVAASARAAGEADDKATQGGWREALNASGSLRGAYWSSTRDLDDEQHIPSASAWLKVAPRFGKAASAHIEGWVRRDGDKSQSQMREAYLDLRQGPVDLRLGQQIIAWGRADELNPTDNLTPRDYTLLVPEASDQRFGTVGARAVWHLGDYALTGAWLPRFRSNIFPIGTTPGVTVTREAPHDAGAALKFERTGRGVEWSVSYYDGLDPNPDLVFAGAGPGGLQLALRNHPIRVLGADVAGVLGRYGLRAEAAYTWTSHDEGPNALVKKPFFYGVAGADRTFDNGTYVNLQYYLRHIAGFSDPNAIADPLQRAIALQSALISNQRDATEHGISLRVSHRWLNDTLEVELLGVISLTRGDNAWRPKLTYALSDSLKLTVGADLFRGGRDTYFGRLRDNSLAYAELKYAF
ncbi:hypothetical protein GCM10028796_09190 [Ramlibacter monticola]|uniref:Alginate export domain-containing protein n=1 Tax=Ramlibacter monticola TaxID=1926872 RepID=A0A937CS71_9BURK|nr:DUF1302 family protein [Ramlibacter monticola]MBL0389777.1 hypothetical protein [Ramlibacter monticola]